MKLITGFPGFLGSEMILRLLEQNASDSFVCLIQSKFLDFAEKQRDAIEKKRPGSAARIQWLEGDITEANLGIAPSSSPILKTITEVFHFAAVYDLNVGEEIAQKVNVEGTRNVLRFLDSLPALKLFHYVSTCYVSGKYEGVFKEEDLEVGQQFNNFYESTKYEAEKLVRASMAKGLPATIYRPAIVVGNSITGETQKFDGVYFVLQWLLKAAKIAILPRMSNPEEFTINLVPSNYVLDAMAYLSQHPDSLGKTFQLADPDPLTIAEVTQVLAQACDRKLIQIPLPRDLVKFAVAHIPGLEKWMGIPRNALDYFVHPTSYDVSETLHALKGSGIACPPFESYARNLVEFMKKHRDTRSKAMI